MKRSTFFAGIFASLGIARGQATGRLVRSEAIQTCPTCMPPLPMLGDPDVCPVCRKKADPYKRKSEAESYGADVCLAGGGDSNVTFSVCRQPSDKILVGPMERVTRCKNCNAAFWQDAEK